MGLLNFMSFLKHILEVRDTEFLWIATISGLGLCISELLAIVSS